MKFCADNRRGAKESSIKPGNTVYLKQPKENKFNAPYNQRLQNHLASKNKKFQQRPKRNAG